MSPPEEVHRANHLLTERDLKIDPKARGQQPPCKQSKAPRTRHNRLLNNGDKTWDLHRLQHQLHHLRHRLKQLRHRLL